MNTPALVAGGALTTILLAGMVIGGRRTGQFSPAYDSIVITSPSLSTVPAHEIAVEPVRSCAAGRPALHANGRIVCDTGRYLTPAEAVRALEESAIDLGTPGFDPIYGYGRPDVCRAFDRAATITANEWYVCSTPVP